MLRLFRNAVDTLGLNTKLVIEPCLALAQEAEGRETVLNFARNDDLVFWDNGAMSKAVLAVEGLLLAVKGFLLNVDAALYIFLVAVGGGVGVFHCCYGYLLEKCP